jgi:hypothetical protein
LRAVAVDASLERVPDAQHGVDHSLILPVCVIPPPAGGHPPGGSSGWMPLEMPGTAPARARDDEASALRSRARNPRPDEGREPHRARPLPLLPDGRAEGRRPGRRPSAARP